MRSVPAALVPAECADSYRVIGGRADRRVVLVCDHAGNEFPEGYGSLGLPPQHLGRHIAYDIGAAAVTVGLAARLEAPAVLSRYSRLLIDLNRGLDDPTLIMRLSDGAIIPGNRNLDPIERERRVRLFYQPYHQAIDRVLDTCVAAGTPPLLLSIHSFTDTWKGVPRPWHAAVLWDRDERLARPLLEALAEPGDILVGDNEPYHGRLEGDCMWQHGTGRGIAHAIVEIRQDLIGAVQGQAIWTDRLAGILEKLLGNPDFVGKLDPRIVPDDTQIATR